MEASVPPAQEQVIRSMRMTVVAFAWVLFVLALPVVTNAGVDGCFCCSLIVLALPLGGVWVTSSVFSTVRMSRGERCLWRSVPVLGLAAVGLTLTDYDLVLRVRLSEPALSEFAEAVRRGEVGGDFGPAGRRVGLMWVWGVQRDESGEVLLVTSQQFLDRTCLAHLPNGPTDDFRFGPRYTHLTGHWYVYFDRF